MVELLFGSFLLGSLYLAFREDREQDSYPLDTRREVRPEPVQENFIPSAYEPKAETHSLHIEEERFLVEEPTLVSMHARSSDLPVIQ